MLHQYAGKSRWAHYVVWPVAAVSLMPLMDGRNLLWEINDLRNDPANQLVAIRDAVGEIDRSEPVYTEVNDIAVMARTAHPTVAVTSGPDPSLPPTRSPPMPPQRHPPQGLYT